LSHGGSNVGPRWGGGGFQEIDLSITLHGDFDHKDKVSWQHCSSSGKRWHMKVIVTNTNLLGKTIMVAHIDLKTKVWHGLKINVPTLIFIMRINVG
jgi:hypothetical protein